MTPSNPLRRRLGEQDGISLLEVIIATFVLSVAIIGLASVASASLVQLRVSRDRQAATDAATSALESMRLNDFASIAMLDTVVGTLGGECPSGGKEEPYVVTSDPDNDLEYETIAGVNGNITVTTIVTWYDDPADGDDDCDTSDTEIKRVQVTASWTERGGLTKSVTQDTLVSPANRGLPFPEFRVGNASAALNFDPTEVSSTVEKCLTHIVSNVGAIDSYDVAITRTDGAFDPSLAVDVWQAPNTGRSLNGRWDVRTFFEYPLQSPVPDAPTAIASSPAWLELMRDVTEVNGRPESDLSLPTGDQARLHVCYEPTTTVDLEEDYGFAVDLHSRFDGNVFETLTHTVSTRSSSEKWYLYDRDDTTVHKRSIAGGYKNPIYEMGPQTTLQPSVIGTSLRDWDTDVDNDGIGGIELPIGDTGKVAIWHEQAATDIEFLGGGIDVNIWVGVEDVLERDDPSAGAYDQDYVFSVKKIAKNEKTVLETWVNAVTVSRTHVFATPLTNAQVAAGQGWELLTARLSFSGQTTYALEKDQFLRVELLCGPGSDQQCEVAYDSTQFPSHIVVETR